MNRRTLLHAVAAGSLALALASCAAPMREAGPRWSGRLALQVEGRPDLAFTAVFDLRGSPGVGELEFLTPLGGTAARLQWVPGQASLRIPGQPERAAASLDDLVRQAIGTTIPVAALFDWLAGIPAPAAGWEADLSERAAGRLRARRLAAPATDLRVILESP